MLTVREDGKELTQLLLFLFLLFYFEGGRGLQQLNCKLYQQKHLAGKQKGNSQIFNGQGVSKGDWRYEGANRNGITVGVVTCLGWNAEHSRMYSILQLKLREVFMASQREFQTNFIASQTRSAEQLYTGLPGWTVFILCSLAGRYGYSAERAQLSKVRPKLPLQVWLAQRAVHSQSRVQDYFAFPSVVH